MKPRPTSSRGASFVSQSTLTQRLQESLVEQAHLKAKVEEIQARSSESAMHAERSDADLVELRRELHEARCEEHMSAVQEDRDLQRELLHAREIVTYQDRLEEMESRLRASTTEVLMAEQTAVEHVARLRVLQAERAEMMAQAEVVAVRHAETLAVSEARLRTVTSKLHNCEFDEEQCRKREGLVREENPAARARSDGGTETQECHLALDAALFRTPSPLSQRERTESRVRSGSECTFPTHLPFVAGALMPLLRVHRDLIDIVDADSSESVESPALKRARTISHEVHAEMSEVLPRAPTVSSAVFVRDDSPEVERSSCCLSGHVSPEDCVSVDLIDSDEDDYELARWLRGAMKDDTIQCDSEHEHAAGALEERSPDPTDLQEELDEGDFDMVEDGDLSDIDAADFSEDDHEYEHAEAEVEGGEGLEVVAVEGVHSEPDGDERGVVPRPSKVVEASDEHLTLVRKLSEADTCGSPAPAPSTRIGIFLRVTAPSWHLRLKQIGRVSLSQALTERLTKALGPVSGALAVHSDHATGTKDAQVVIHTDSDVVASQILSSRELEDLKIVRGKRAELRRRPRSRSPLPRKRHSTLVHVPCEPRDIPHSVFDRDGVLVVYKPAYWTVTTSGKCGGRSPPMQSWLRKHLGARHPFLLSDRRAGLIHRLDVQTSGPLLIATRRDTFAHMRQSLHDRKWYKEYITLMHGQLPLERCSGVLTYPLLSKQFCGGWKTEVCPEGQAAKTRYHAVAAYSRTVRSETRRYTLVRVHLVTGRTHQIRVHLAELARELGLPICGLVGDYKYLQRSQLAEDRRLCTRVFLHERFLEFPAPSAASTKVCVKCPLPRELDRTLSQLKRDDRCTRMFQHAHLDSR